MKAQHLVIAVDGLSGSGKSVISKAIAKHFGYAYLDTGSVYRAITLLALKNGLNIEAFREDKVDTYAPLINLLKKVKFEFKYDSDTNKAYAYIDGKDVTSELKTPVVSNLVPKVSKIEDVRVWTRTFQYKYADKKNIVMEGRDITTVVFPNARVKLFVTTDLDVRAQRRVEDYKKLGKFQTIESVKQDLESRDHQDIFRKNSPLKVSPDAIVIDTSHSTAEESIAEAITQIENKLSKK